MTERLVAGTASLLGARTSRRGFLMRLALAGSAFVTAPIRYLVRPQSAWAVISPGDCPSGALCNDGWTAFCCEVNGGRNSCPPNSYIAGWWKCTEYRGGGLCGPQGVRYYVDCNRTPGRSFAGGCHCARGDCGRRRVDCNQFRYGQCNAHIGGTTEVACRLVTCQHPATVADFNCNRTYKEENRVCGQEAGCLRGVLVQLAGGGGA